MTNYPRLSLVRGLACDWSHREWVRFKTARQINMGLGMIESRDGSKYGTTREMQSTVDLWRRSAESGLSSFSSRTGHWATVSNLGNEPFSPLHFSLRVVLFILTLDCPLHSRGFVIITY